jgi:hypothetical protein
MNWVASNTTTTCASRVETHGPLGFFMPGADAAARLDSLDPDAFQYEITAREIQ